MKRKVALIFGGSRGIGSATVRSLARDHFDVAFTFSVDKEAARSTAAAAAQASAEAQVAFYPADIRDAVSIRVVFENVEKEFGRRPSAIIASAGVNVQPAPVAQFDSEKLRDLVEANVIGAFNMLHGAANNVDDGGTIVAITTSLVRHAVAGMGPYAATKAAVECMVRSMAKELAARKVRVNAVAPGPIDTDLFRAGKTEDARLRSAALSPFNRVGAAEEVGEVIAFLVSPRASWVTGQVVQPNGGLV